MIALWVAAGLLVSPAHAKSWCATPLVVHEWGVQVFHGPGAQPVDMDLPPWFHRRASVGSVGVTPVRSLPADGGEREIPVLQFYASRVYGDGVPVAVELGLIDGQPSVWYPREDRLLPARPDGDAGVQLAWDALSLTVQARVAPQATQLPWIGELREVPQALWVNRGGQSERFLFYEAQTRAKPSVRIEGDRLINSGSQPVHDLIVVSRSGGVVRVDQHSVLSSDSHAALDLEPMDDAAATLRTWLAAALAADEGVEALDEWSMDMDDCVMMRDPAVPVRSSEGHGLYPQEIDALLNLWQVRFFEQQGTVLLYREDPAALDAAAPLSVYTDMNHFVRMSRAGLVLWEGLALE